MPAARRPRLAQLAWLGITAILAACAGAPLPASPQPSASALPHATPAVLTTVWKVDEGIEEPTGLALARDGTVLVIDFQANVIHRLDQSGRSLGPWARPGSDPGALAAAAGIAVDAQGSVYVADHDNYRVQKFDPTGTYRSSWGTKGAGSGQFDAPDGIAVSPTGEIWVTEDKNARIQVFDAEGNFKRLIAGGSPSSFGDPTGIAFAKNRVYLADFKANKIWILSPEGNITGAIGGAGAGDGQFAGISLLATDAADNLFATDYGNGRIEQFDPSGAFVGAFIPEADGRFAKPYGLAIGADGDLYLSQSQAGTVERLHRP